MKERLIQINQKIRGILRRLPLYKSISIRYKIAIIAIIVVLIPMSLSGVYFYSSLSSILTKNEHDNLEHLMKQTHQNLQSSFDMIDRTYMHLLVTPSLRRNIFYLGDDKDEYSMLRTKLEIESQIKYNMLFDSAWNDRLIKTIYLFLDENNYSSLSRSSAGISTANENNINVYLNTKQVFNPNRIFIPPSLQDETIYMAKNIYNINTNRLFGRLIIGINENTLFEKYSKILQYKDAKAFIFDENGVIFSHEDKAVLGTNADHNIIELTNTGSIKNIKIEGKNHYFTSRKIENTNLSFVIGIPQSEVLSKVSASMKNYIYITLLIVFSGLALSILLSVFVSKFIKEFTYSLNMVKAGEYQVKMRSYKNPELNLLSQTFNKMTSKIKFLINQVYEKQLILKETEFKFLQSQMDPHFLFNTLATIKYKAKLGETESVHSMVTSLSELLYASIYRDKEAKITIEQELEYVKLYLFLQKKRFEDNLEYNINVRDDSILEYYLPKLCVEPIVENAIVHGLESKVGKGMINLNVYTEKDSVFIEVIDDGVGFDIENINFKKYETLKISDQKHCRIGLINTDRRIKIIYGELYGIKIESNIGKGSKVVIHIPIDKGDD